MWLHRHCADGSLAPSWGLHQIDETGAAIFAFEATWRETGDEALDRELWPAAERAADFLLAFRDEATGLPLPSVDLWEERWGRHAYSAAAVYGGLRAAAAMAARHNCGRAAHYADTAGEIAAAIERSLWDERSMRFLRAVDSGVPTGDAGRLPYPEEIAASVAGPREPDAARTMDASLLGLAWPYAAVEPGGDRMRRTVETLETRLTFEDGGLARYDGDTYAGGNAWLLTTLWLGLWHRQIGDDDGHRRSIDYAISRQTPVGLLPEQCSPSGSPAWVVPLTWSHAMFVLAARPDLQIVSDFTATAGRMTFDGARAAPSP
jgi:GH15 family glucan-1,4-alpha-glucosidase